MLSRIHVKNLALIDEADVELKNGFNVLTGETGAGKSILLGSIGLALGGKVPKDFVREGCEYGLVELAFEIEKEETVRALCAMDLEPDESELVISRRIKGNKCTNKVNGQLVTAGELKKLGEILIDIYGQNEHQTLLSEKNHLKLLDEYGGEVLVSEREKVEILYKERREAETEFLSFDMDEEKRLREMDLIEYEIKELEAADLHIGEDEELEQQYKKCANARKIMDALAESYEALSENGASAFVTKAVREIAFVVSYDEGMKPIYDELTDLDGILSEVLRALNDYKDELVYDEERLQNLENRLDLINRLKAKYGKTISKILDYYQKRQEEMETLRDYEIRKEQAGKRWKRAERELRKEAGILSVLRKETAKTFEKKMEQVLLDLNFLNVRFAVAFEETEKVGQSGLDAVRFLISTNPGEPVRPLAKIASGGELSRIMLGLKTIFADMGGTETLIFDEIDTGISGRTAQMVSEKLALISTHHQIICITHLPQIAAMADAHYFIEKTADQNRTQTTIRELWKEESVKEIARMLGGVKITESVLNNAAEMKELAEERKKRH